MGSSRGACGPLLRLLQQADIDGSIDKEVWSHYFQLVERHDKL